MQMTTFIEPTKEQPMLNMNLKGDTEFSRALKDVMLGMGLYGDAVYKGFPVAHVGQ
jgi:hypothetical protein